MGFHFMACDHLELESGYRQERGELQVGGGASWETSRVSFVVGRFIAVQLDLGRLEMLRADCRPPFLPISRHEASCKRAMDN
jgi:hypothetical protein